MSTKARQTGPSPVSKDTLTPDTMAPSLWDQIKNARRDGFEFVKQLFLQIRVHPHLALSKHDVKRMGIDVFGLDLRTGAGSDGGPIFISPMPSAELDSLLDMKQPWLTEPFPRIRPSNGMSAGMDIGYFLRDWLDQSVNPDDDGIIMATPWRGRAADPQNLIFETLVHKEGNAYWQDILLLDQRRAEVPHLISFVADHAEMREDNLLASELWCALGLMAGRMRISRYYKHGIVPVTVMTCAGRSLRVLQAFYDRNKKRIVVRKSPMLSFEKENLEYTKIALSWLIGRAVGETRFIHFQNGQDVPIPRRK